METTTIEIRRQTHELLKKYAEAHGFKISRIGDQILRAFLEKEGEEAHTERKEVG